MTMSEYDEGAMDAQAEVEQLTAERDEARKEIRRLGLVNDRLVNRLERLRAGGDEIPGYVAELVRLVEDGSFYDDYDRAAELLAGAKRQLGMDP